MRFSGHDPVNPINANDWEFGASATPNSYAITTDVDNCMILQVGGFDDDDITVDAPGLVGYTAVTMDLSGTGIGTCSGGAGYKIQANAGSSGTTNFVLTGSEEFRIVTFAIAPEACP